MGRGSERSDQRVVCCDLMFGMGGTEILVILIVALLFLGPEKLPDAAKKISKGIRDIKQQSRVLQRTIEDDEHIGGAIRDLKSALRGDEAPPARPKRKKPRKLPELAPGDVVIGLAPRLDANAEHEIPADAGEPPQALPDVTAMVAAIVDSRAAGASPSVPPTSETTGAVAAAAVPPKLTLPAMAGEADPDPDAAIDSDHRELAAMIKPVGGTVAKGSEPDHG